MTYFNKAINHKKNSMHRSSALLKIVCFWLSALSLLVASQAYAATFYFHSDHLGTPQVLTDNNQQIVWQGEQDPFGETTESVNSIEQNLRFPGQYFDTETGMHYNYFREYSPTLGRYTQSDPIGLEGGLNTYIYALNNPLVYTDPAGLSAGAAVGAGVVVFCAKYPKLCVAGAVAVCQVAGGCSIPIDAIQDEICPINDEDDDNRCDYQYYEVDTPTCKSIAKVRGKAAGAVCYASAEERYSACLAGRPMPPLNTWNN